MFPVSQFSDNCRCKGDTLWLGWRESQADGSCFAWRGRFHADPIREPRGGEWHVVEDASIAAQEAPPTAGGSLLVVTIGLAVAAGALAIWWLNSLNGLPDIGDPFDVAEFRGFPHSRRTECLHLFPASVGKSSPPCPSTVAMDDPRLHDWFEANRPLVDLFIQAAECADGISGRRRAASVRIDLRGTTH